MCKRFLTTIRGEFRQRRPFDDRLDLIRGVMMQRLVGWGSLPTLPLLGARWQGRARILNGCLW